MGNVRQYRCNTCGILYESSGYDAERADGMMEWRLDKPHECPYPSGTFFIRTETEYKWVEGVLHTRTVVYRKPSSNDVLSYRLVKATNWEAYEDHDFSGQGGRF